MADAASLARHVPVISWLPGYDRSWLSKDARADLWVWALPIAAASRSAICPSVAAAVAGPR